MHVFLFFCRTLFAREKADDWKHVINTDRIFVLDFCLYRIKKAKLFWFAKDSFDPASQYEQIFYILLAVIASENPWNLSQCRQAWIWHFFDSSCRHQGQPLDPIGRFIACGYLSWNWYSTTEYLIRKAFCAKFIDSIWGEGRYFG